MTTMAQRRSTDPGPAVPGQERQVQRRSTEDGQPLTTFLKTKMCTFYQLGACTRGQFCRYAHTEKDLNPDSFYRTRFCKSVIRFGKCENPDCTYAHNKEELREPPSITGGACDSVAEDQGFTPVSRMVEQLDDDQCEQLLKYHLLRLPASRRNHIMTWLLKESVREDASPLPSTVDSTPQQQEQQQQQQQGTKCVEAPPPRPRLCNAAYKSSNSIVQDHKRVKGSEPARVDVPGWANDVAASSPATTSACLEKEDTGSVADIKAEFHGAGYEIKNTFVSEVVPKRPELRRQGNTIGCLPQLELSSERCKAIEQKGDLRPQDVCPERGENHD